ncbi:MAG: hypothetical protein OSB70_17620 [Myxococcota bacterium]|nr:hypothetical protein [Myxococcota bacterium]
MSEFNLEATIQAVKARMEADPEGTADAGIDAESIAKALSHPLAPAELERSLPIEAASVAEGAPAPDFSLARLGKGPGGEVDAVTLSSHFGKRPVALIFGSYT